MFYNILTAVSLMVVLLAIDPIVVQGAALALAGSLAVPITEIVKRLSGFSQGAAFLTAGAVAVICTVAAIFFTGQFHGVKDLVASSAIVFSISQAVFKIIVADKGASFTSNDLRS
jgi:hypothetical protein